MPTREEYNANCRAYNKKTQELENGLAEIIGPYVEHTCSRAAVRPDHDDPFDMSTYLRAVPPQLQAIIDQAPDHPSHQERAVLFAKTLYGRHREEVSPNVASALNHLR